MNADAQIIELKKEIQELREEVANLRNGGLRGSKAEAFMALQYDSLPDWYKSPNAVAFYKKFQTVGLIIILLGFAGFAIMIADQIHHDHERRWLFQEDTKVSVGSANR